MRKPVLVVLWIVATLATTVIAYLAVNAAGAEVTDRPLTSVVAAGATTATSVSPGSPLPRSNTPGVTTTGRSSASTDTTAPVNPWQPTTIPSSGGLVVVSHRTGEVRLESVAPAPGYTYEIDESGPPRVRIEFHGGDRKVEVRVEWEGGLVTQVDENA